VTSDRGSVLLLGIGLMAVCFLALAVIADVSAAFLQRRTLTAIADGAALAGAQAIDIDTYYREGATIATALNPTAVRSAVIQYVDRSHVQRRLPGFRIDTIASGSQIVHVQLSAPAKLTFFPELTGPITVIGRARLDYREGP